MRCRFCKIVNKTWSLNFPAMVYTQSMLVERRTMPGLYSGKPAAKQARKPRDNPAGGWLGRGMKRVNMDELLLVHCGEQWSHEQPPCSRLMIRHLERNEDVVTWVQVRVPDPQTAWVPGAEGPAGSPRPERWKSSFQ